MPKPEQFINLETGEVLAGAEQVKFDTEVEATEPEPDLLHFLPKLNMLLNDEANNVHIHFTTQRTGTLVHESQRMDLTVRYPRPVKIDDFTIILDFTIKGKKLVVSTPSFKHSITIQLAQIVSQKDTLENWRTRDNIMISNYKTTKTFNHRFQEMSVELYDFLIHKMFQATMLAKMEFRFYHELNPKIILGEEIMGEVMERNTTGYAITKKGNRRIIYVYQSMLEQKSIEELAHEVQK